MKFIYALFCHAWLAVKLKHDGTGLPANMPAAFALVALYIALSLANTGGDVGMGSWIALSFIAQFYVFCLRDQLIGLIILIGVITNAFALFLGFFVSITEAMQLLLSMFEFVMIFGAVVNVIRTHAKIS